MGGGRDTAAPRELEKPHLLNSSFLAAEHEAGSSGQRLRTQSDMKLGSGEYAQLSLRQWFLTLTTHYNNQGTKKKIIIQMTKFHSHRF